MNRKMSFVWGVALIVAVGALPGIVQADQIVAKIKTKDCAIEGAKCFIGGKYTRNRQPVSGIALLLQESLDCSSFRRVSNRARVTDSSGSVRFGLRSDGAGVCYRVVTAPNGNDKKDYRSNVVEVVELQ